MAGRCQAGGQGAAASCTTATASEVETLEARVAELHLQAQALNKQPGREAEATAVYKQLAALDDQALALRLAAAAPATATQLAAHAAQHPGYCCLPPQPPSWAQAANQASNSGGASVDAAQLRRRAEGAMLGYALADAAACPLQWVYSEVQLQRLVQGVPGGELEFFDPPQCPFFDYPTGAASPYGEQTAVLLHSLVQGRGLDPYQYAAALYQAFGPGFEGYRDRSTKNFLRRYAAGALPPATGSPDDQANCFTRLPPLVALYAGAGTVQLLGAVERMVRVTQDDDVAVAYGCAAALVLEAVMLGGSVTAAVAAAIDWLQEQQRQQQVLGGAGAGTPQQAAQVPQHALPVLPAALWGEVAARLEQAAELAPLPPLEAATLLGRNCHLPNSLCTPIQVLLHLEHRHAVEAGGAAGSSELDASPGVRQRQAQPQQAQGQQQLSERSTAADDDFCLPCSMGSGTACALPERAPGRSGSSVLSAGRRQAGGPASMPPSAFVEAVRLAIRPGGCCASRAGFVGALAGALVAGHGEQLPVEWRQEMPTYAEVAGQAQQLLELRD